MHKAAPPLHPSSSPNPHAAEMGETMPMSQVSTPDPAIPPDFPPADMAAPPSIPAPDPTILTGLQALGFSQRTTQNLLQAYPPDRIHAALLNLPHRNAQNPAGYLVRELQSADYAIPASRGNPIRRPIGLPKPTPEQRAAQHQADAHSDGLQTAIAALLPDIHSALWQQARRTCARLGRPSVPDDSPLLRAQFELLVEAHIQTQRCA